MCEVLWKYRGGPLAPTWASHRRLPTLEVVTDRQERINTLQGRRVQFTQETGVNKGTEGLLSIL